jgi:hypothetical protein
MEESHDERDKDMENGINDANGERSDENQLVVQDSEHNCAASTEAMELFYSALRRKAKYDLAKVSTIMITFLHLFSSFLF